MGREFSREFKVTAVKRCRQGFRSRFPHRAAVDQQFEVVGPSGASFSQDAKVYVRSIRGEGNSDRVSFQSVLPRNPCERMLS